MRCSFKLRMVARGLRAKKNEMYCEKPEETFLAWSLLNKLFSWIWDTIYNADIVGYDTREAGAYILYECLQS